MTNRLALAAGLLALSTGLAAAQTVAPGSTVPDPEAATKPKTTAPNTMAPPVPAATAPTGAGGDAAWRTAKLAKVSLAQALATAQAQGEAGGRAIEADFGKGDGATPAHYAVKVVYPGGKLVEYAINADTGAVYRTENEPIERYFTFLRPADFMGAKTSLKDALAIAEQNAGGGKAYAAEVSRDGKAVQYLIRVAGADGERTVVVGPDGKVLG